MDSSISDVLARIDGRGYKAYRDLEGRSERVAGVTVRVVRVQGDPFAPPSIVSLEANVSHILKGAPECRGARTAFEDLTLRTAGRVANDVLRGVPRMGEGHSGQVRIARPGPIMVPRSSVRLEGDRIRLLVRAGLPSRGRRILARNAHRLLLEILPRIMRETLTRMPRRISEWCKLWRDQEEIRRWMGEEGVVSFIADGSILPRRCGGCWEPLPNAKPFRSPESLRVEVETRFHGTLTGMALREGLNLIVGPAFHGKTTLLQAIAQGVWNHIPGDGRELVLTRRDAVLVESENGRSVRCVDLRAFLRSLPGGGDLKCFTTESASGATSVASSIQEAVMGGSRLILLDEDNVATNFLHRDVWVEEFTGKRTLVTLTELAASMKRRGISLIVVASGALPLLAAADTIIVMDEYEPVDATHYKQEAEKRAQEAGLARAEEYIPPTHRNLAPPRVGKWKLRGDLLELQLQGGRRQVLLHAGVAKQFEDPYMLETAVEAALTARDPTGLVERSMIPERTWVRELDVWMILNKLPLT